MEMGVFGHVQASQIPEGPLIRLAGKRLHLVAIILKETGDSGKAPFVYCNIMWFSRDRISKSPILRFCSRLYDIFLQFDHLPTGATTLPILSEGQILRLRRSSSRVASLSKP
jgi:hypothetical protein